ncbi:hypothetical protein HID58_069204, partial [Brassica napus]
EPILYSFLLSSSRQLEGQQYSRIISVESLSGNEAEMGFEDDPYRDVDGEPLVDLDDDFGGDDREPLEDFEDNLADDRGTGMAKSNPGNGWWKKASSDKQTIDVPELIDEDVEDAVFDEYMEEEEVVQSWEEEKNEKERESSSSGGGKEKRYKLPSRGERKSEEIDEMWKSIAHNPENDEEGVRTMDDDNFIDDTGVDPSERYGGDGGDRSPTHYPQAEEGEDDDEVNNLFKMGKKKKKAERNPAEIALLVRDVMAELEVTAEEDAELNRQGSLLSTSLRNFPFLPMKQLQTEFLDHGVLTLLKNWLEPLPDGSLPSINIRAAILRILTDVIIPTRKLLQHRRLAKDLVDKWSRPIFNKSTRFEDMRNLDEDRAPYRRPPVKKPVNKASTMESRDGTKIWSDFGSEFEGRGDSSRNMTMRPEATPMDFLIRPQSKIDPDEVRARAKQVSQDQRRVKMNKKLQQPKRTKEEAFASHYGERGRSGYDQVPIKSLQPGLGVLALFYLLSSKSNSNGVGVLTI